MTEAPTTSRIRPPDRVGQPRRARRPRLALPLLLVAALLLVWLAYAAFLLLDARSELVAGRAALDAGTEAVTDGRVQEGLDRLAEASVSFQAADDRLANPAPRSLELVPLVGRNVEVVRRVTGVGATLGADVLAVARAVGETEVRAAIAPRGGALPLAPLEQAAAPLEELRGAVVEARATLDALPRTLLLPSIASARDGLEDQLAGRQDELATAAALARSLPGFLGADGARRYLVGAQDPAEMRAAGGFVGAFSVLRASAGRLELDPFIPQQDLDEPPAGSVPPPTDDYARRFARYGGTSDFQNVNFSPDVPTSAAALAASYEFASGTEVDGVLLVSPGALGRLAEEPVDVPGIGTLAPEQIEPYLVHDAFIAFDGDSRRRKEVLGDVARVVLETFLAGGTDPLVAATDLARAFADGELLLYSDDPDEQADFVTAGVAGALPEPDGDVLGVFFNNVGENKIDAFLDVGLDYHASLLPDGLVEGTVELTLRNDAPLTGETLTIIGPNRDELDAGDSLLRVDTACGEECSIATFALDGEPVVYRLEEERDLVFAATELRIPGGTETLLRATTRTSDGWEPTETGLRYRLRVAARPLVRPAPFTVEVAVPEGLRVEDVSAGGEVLDGAVRWTGFLGGERELSVELVTE